MSIECRVLHHLKRSVMPCRAIPSTGIHRIELHCPFPRWCENRHLHDCDSHSPLSSRLSGYLVYRFSMSNMCWKDLCMDGMLDQGYLRLQNALKAKRNRKLGLVSVWIDVYRSILHTIQNAFTGCDNRTVGTQVIRHTFPNFAWLKIIVEWNRLVELSDFKWNRCFRLRLAHGPSDLDPIRALPMALDKGPLGGQLVVDIATMVVVGAVCIPAPGVPAAVLLVAGNAFLVAQQLAV